MSPQQRFDLYLGQETIYREYSDHKVRITLSFDSIAYYVRHYFDDGTEYIRSFVHEYGENGAKAFFNESVRIASL